MEQHEHELTDRTSGDVVVRDGCVHWHSRPTCDVRDAREGVVAYRAGLRDAWASCLLPCPGCATGDASLAADRWGAPTRVERARLTLPVLQDLESGVAIVPTSPHTAGVRRLPPVPTAPEQTPAGPVPAPAASHRR